MIKTIPITSIFNFISKQVRAQEQDDEQLLSWAYQRYRTSQNALRWIKDMTFLEVENYQAKLPSTVQRIWRVLHCVDKLNIEELEDCECEPREGTSDPTATIDQSAGLVYHTLFLNSQAYRDKFMPMAYAGTPLSKKFICNVHTGQCNGAATYSLSSDFCSIRTSFEQGVIALEFLATPLDEEGLPLIPEQPTELWQGMAHYAEAQHWRNRAAMKEESAFGMFQSNLQMANQYMREANAFLTGRLLRQDIARAQIYGPARVLRVHHMILKNRTE